MIKTNYSQNFKDNGINNGLLSPGILSNLSSKQSLNQYSGRISPTSSHQVLKGKKKIKNITERLSIGLSFAPGSIENNIDLDALAEGTRGLMPDYLSAVKELNVENDHGLVKISATNTQMQQSHNKLQ